MSWNGLNLEKNQAMPTQARKPTKPKKEANATAPAAAPATTSAPKAKSEAPAVAAVTSPKAEKKAPASKPQAAASATTAPAAAAKKPAKKEESTSSPPAAKPTSSASPDASTGSTDKPERSPPTPRVFHSGFGLVKAVLSGDSLVLAGSSSGGVEIPEKVISLTGVTAPKFGRGPKQADEPYAWESREYLRKHVIGQQVQFVVQSTINEGKDSERNYGTVQLKGIDIATQMIKAGFVRVKVDDKKKVYPEKEALLALETKAIESGLGMHKKGADAKNHLREIDWNPKVQEFFTANKGQALPGVVDQVRDGSTLRVELIHPQAPLKHTMITLNLAGVSCPRTPLPLSVLKQRHAEKVAEDKNYGAKNKEPTTTEKAEPFALEAQAYTEDRLLNRDVQVILQGVDKSNNLFGTVVFAKGSITAKLLEQGFGKLVPWSASLTPDAAKLAAAQAQAQKQKLRIWKNYVEGQAAASSSSAGSKPAEFHGKVVSVPSSDSIIVEDGDQKEVRIWLASVRAPRGPARGKASDDGEDYAYEAKELLRSKLIGLKVRVVPEYVRASAADDEREARVFATVFQGKINVNEALISAGLAESMPHRMDEERSSHYDAFIAAEAAAKKANRGKWDLSKKYQPPRIVDLTERAKVSRKPKAAAPKAPADGAEADDEDAEKKEDDKPKSAPAPSKAELANNKIAQKAKDHLKFLQNTESTAVVEYVFSASRFKLYVPKEHLMISLSLSGIRTPAPKTADGKDHPLALEILQYVRSKVQQHTVKIEVEVVDKAGNFLGSLFHNRVNLAVDLLQQGYAEIFGFSAAKSRYSKELYAAERQAQEAKRGIWAFTPIPEKEVATAGRHGEEEEESKESGPTERVARITEIVDCSDFYVQWVGDKNAELVEKALAAVAALPETTEPFKAPANANGRPFVAAGQFSDDSWHRVRCDSQVGDDWNVYFIDYGNHDLLLGDRVRALPAEAAKIPPLAVHAALAGLSAPKAPEYQEGSALAFSEMAFGIDLKATVEFTDKFGRKHLTLSHDSHPISVNRQLLKDGWARVQTRPDRRISKLINELQEEENYAKRNHYNLFEYGDVSDEEEGGEKVLGPDPKARGQKPAAAKK